MGITAFKLPKLKETNKQESTESLQRLRRPLFIEATASPQKDDGAGQSNSYLLIR